MTIVIKPGEELSQEAGGHIMAWGGWEGKSGSASQSASGLAAAPFCSPFFCNLLDFLFSLQKSRYSVEV